MSHYKPYPAYKHSDVEWIGQLPTGWHVKPICRVASCNDDALPEDTPADQALRYVDISAVTHTDGITQVTEFRFADAPSRARRKARAGDVVVSTVRTYLKAVAVVTDDHADCIYSTGFAVLRARNPQVEPAFLKWMALNELLIQAIESHSEGLSYPAINASELIKLKVVIPPPAEQSAIAAALNRETARIDALIARKARFIELLKEKRRAIIIQAVTKGLDPHVKMRDSEVEWIGEVPEHWSVSRLGHFATIENGTTPSRANESYWIDGDVPWVGSGEVNQVSVTQASEYITALALRECSLRLLPKGTVIVGMVGQGKTRGLAATLDIEATINQNLAAVCVGSKLDGHFLLHVLTAAYEWLREGGRGSNQAALNCELIGEFRLAVPPKSEQGKIVGHITDMIAGLDAIVSKTERSMDLLKEHRSALITAAVTGRIDLRGEIAA